MAIEEAEQIEVSFIVAEVNKVLKAIVNEFELKQPFDPVTVRV